jgi:hypothetical protein
MKAHEGSVQYNYSEGDIINQSGSFNVGVDKSKKVMFGSHPDLSQIVQQVSEILNRLTKTFPNEGVTALAQKASDYIALTPDLSEKLRAVVNGGSLEALEKMLPHPVAREALATFRRRENS